MRKIELFPGANRGNCSNSGSDIDFFSQKRNKDPRAIVACKSCPVREECLEWGLHNELFNIYGGMDEDERTVERKIRGIPTPPISGAEKYLIMPSVDNKALQRKMDTRRWRERVKARELENA